MMCPTLIAATIIAKGLASFDEDTAEGLVKCGDWCGWWDDKKEQCCIKTIAQKDSISIKGVVSTHGS